MRTMSKRIVPLRGSSRDFDEIEEAPIRGYPPISPLTQIRVVDAFGRGILCDEYYGYCHAAFTNSNTTVGPGLRSARLSVYPSNHLDCPAFEINDYDR